jgi:PAS domain S-box-containing protein
MTKELKTLLVDDSEDDALLVARELRKSGYNLTFQRVDTPEDMRRALLEIGWDVIIVDYKMPHFTGIDALKIARETNPEIPFILVSGVIVEEMAVEAMRRGANDCIKKENIERLTPTVARELQAAQERRERKIAESMLAQKNIELSQANKELIQLNSELETKNKELFNINEQLEMANSKLIESQNEIIETNDMLSESRRKLSTLIANLPGIAYRCLNDRDWTMEFISSGCREITGYETEELIKNSLLSFNDIIVDEDRDIVWDCIQEAVQQSQPYELRYRIKTKEGIIKWVWEKGSGIFNSRGELTALEGFINDITDVIRKDEQIRQIQKMEVIGTLAGGIAHDFNNILGGIIGGAELLVNILEKETLHDSEHITRYLNTIRNASIRASELIKQLLMLSRKHELKLEHVDINNSIKNVADICTSSFPKSIEIQTKLFHRPAIIIADPTHIEQVLLNLCVNASHAMTIMRQDDEPEGGILNISIVKVTGDQSFLCLHNEAKPRYSYFAISVSDSGIGINKADITKLFEPFVTTKKDGAGSGLGLAIVNSIIRQYDGFIEVLSEKGKGSTFIVYVPFLKSSEDNIKDKESECDEDLSGTGVILIVDDEEVMRTIAGEALEECGCTVISAASDGTAALKYFRERWKEIDAVFLDFSMPGLSGKEVYLEMKKINPDVKVVLTSGSSNNDKIKDLISNEFMEFIQKPYNLNLLKKKIKTLVKH